MKYAHTWHLASTQNMLAVPSVTASRRRGAGAPRKIWERGGRDLRVALWRRVHCVLGWATPVVLISPLLGGTCVFQLSLEMRTCHLSE